MKWLVAASLFWTFPSSALGPDLSLWRLGANVNLVGTEEINQYGREWQPALGLEAGLDFEPWSAGISWRHTERDSESGALSIKTRQERLMAVGRYYWHGDTDWLAWLHGGVGLEWSGAKLGTGAGRSDSLESERELVLGGGLGFAWPLTPDWRTEVSGAVHKTQTRSSLETSASVSLVLLL